MTSQDLLMTKISDFACKECDGTGKSLRIYFYFCIIFFTKTYTKFNFCIDENSHVLPAYNPSAVIHIHYMR